MANKRMFSLSVVDTDLFLEMPVTSRLLYYELGMRADDDGFVDNWKKIMRMTSLSEDDMKILIAKRFVIPFESGVIVIRHWKMNNYLRSDRYTPTVYKEELNKLQIENETYELKDSEKSTMLPSGIPTVYTGKDRLGKDSLGKDNNICENETFSSQLQKIYSDECSNLPQVKVINDSRKKAIEKFKKTFTLEQFREICQKANKSSFLTGNNERGWKADFDFLLRIDKATNILEGKFTDKEKIEQQEEVRNDKWAEFIKTMQERGAT